MYHGGCSACYTVRCEGKSVFGKDAVVQPILAQSHSKTAEGMGCSAARNDDIGERLGRQVALLHQRAFEQPTEVIVVLIQRTLQDDHIRIRQTNDVVDGAG